VSARVAAQFAMKLHVYYYGYFSSCSSDLGFFLLSPFFSCLVASTAFSCKIFYYYGYLVIAYQSMREEDHHLENVTF
jgi:hypothetical protein